MAIIVFYIVIFVVAIKIGSKYKSFGLIWLYSFLFTFLFDIYLNGLEVILLYLHSELLAGQLFHFMIVSVISGTLVHGLICGLIASIWRSTYK